MSPIIERIAEKIARVVRGVTKSRGYPVTIMSATRPPRTRGFIPVDMQAIIRQGDPQENDSTYDSDSWICPFSISIIVQHGLGDDDPVDAKLNQARSAVEKALSVDRTLGGLADSLRIRAPERWDDAEGHSGISINIDVFYHHAKGDPYTEN